MEDGAEIAEHVAEEGGDHTDEKGGGEDIAPALIAVFYPGHAALQLFADERYQPDAQHDADGHNPSNGDILGGSKRGDLTEHQTHGALGIGGGNGLIGKGADDRKTQPRQRQTQILGKGDDADNNGNGGGNGKDTGGDHRFTQLLLVHADLLAAAHGAYQKKDRLCQHGKNDDAGKHKQNRAVDGKIHTLSLL